ncbi:MAG: ABC transporter ATP-binding protein [Pelagimonas sp.]|jgi:putative hydroxymethylpyrimidine transport system ATP-binding protein|nr:ABC transporter ATP-binding protein [Pelagimonas sp.]
MTQPAPEITLRGSYQVQGKAIFSQIDLRFGAGHWSCLLGKSGVGKSTVLRLVLGLDMAGTFDGQIATNDGRPVTGRASYMAQTDLLLPWLTVRENVLLGARLRAEPPDLARADQLIERVGLGAYGCRKPSALSGGMRQRAALARCLMEERPVVLLDEPFSALDAGTRADMQDLAAGLLQGKTVLLVTHDPAEACRLGHQVTVLSPGGTQDWPLPPNPPIRDADNPDVLQAQAALLDHLRKPNT